MKPELTLQKFDGYHNADIDGSRNRVIRGGSWKKQRIVIIVPAADKVPAKAAFSWWNLAFPPNQGVAKILATGLEVGDAYSSCIEEVLKHPELSTWEFVLTIEHDNLPPPDGVIALLAQMEAHKELACIGGLYWTKGEGGVAQIWGDPKDAPINFRPQPPVPGQLVECVGTGMGFNLWRMAMFKDERLKRPLFRTVAGKEGVGTQDLAFWAEARKYGYRCAVDCAVAVGHIDDNGMVW